ncbi:uncharacterized protein LOC131882093 [Tigriopus californicus]|uniref:uncharacterized protein LOC131882093 n=1 Tax=Tigriopus californicus TaxID=6832 RepID=UPI0027DAA4C4|nr:uncharacterized protein LOC131882093 [Tigriopus californicus]
MYERYPVPLGVLILGLFVCTWAQEESSTMNTGSVMPNNSTEPVPHFLKHGESYAGQTADTILSRTIKTVALALTIDNWSKWALIDPFFDIQCGELVSSLSKQNQRDPVQLIKPGYSEMMLFEKKSGISGVCGVVTIGLEVPPKEDPEYIQIMFSVPFSLSVRGSYLAVGISPILINATGLFNSFYYYDELTFERQESGNLVEFASDRGMFSVPSNISIHAREHKLPTREALRWWIDSFCVPHPADSTNIEREIQNNSWDRHQEQAIIGISKSLKQK